MTKRSALTGRERVLLALAHKATDRVPIAMVCSGINEPARREFADHLRRERGLDLDAFLDDTLDIAGVGPQYTGPALAADTDIWGVRRQAVSYGAASYDEITHHPLGGIEDAGGLERHPWPTTALFDYTVLPGRIKAIQKARERCLMAANGNIFETSWYMRGFEQMFMDMALNPDLARGILDRVTDFYIAHFTRILAAADGGVDLVFTADDIAGQNGLLMSLDMWEAFIKPCHVRLNRAIQQFGTRVIYHSDGAVMEAVPGLIDMGIDILQALQFDAAGMDPVRLKERYGRDLCFEGGVSVQKTLPFGTPTEVAAETRRLIATLGRGGGYILGPSHAIQAGTPPANIMAMFDAALGCASIA